LRTRILIGAVLVAAVSLSGCTGDKPGKSTAGQPDSVAVVKPPAVTATPAVDQIAGLSLPIEAYMLTAQQRRVLYAAATKVTNDCLTSFGFTDPQQPPVAYQPDLLTHRYGVTDPVAAAQFGYHDSPATAEIANAQKPAAGNPVSGAEQVVLDGYPDDKAKDAANKYNGKQVPAGGCTGEARRQTRSDVLDDADPDGIVAQIATASEKQSETDSRVVAVFQKWSTCMTAKGFAYKMPIGMADDDPDLARSFAASTASPREIQTAVTDVDCKKKNNVVGVWFAVETAYQKTMIQQKQQRLTAVRNAIEETMRACATIGG
jgi:hypothetical protein